MEERETLLTFCLFSFLVPRTKGGDTNLIDLVLEHLFGPYLLMGRCDG